MENVIYVAVGALSAWLLKEIYALYKDNHKDLKVNQNDLSDEITLLKIAITELRVEMRMTREGLQDFTRLRKDVDALHAKVREIGQQ